MRETITLSTQDPERVAEALPILLPQLGIPTDAVGHVYRTISDEHNTSVGVTEPARDVYAGGEPTGSNAATETDSGTAGVQTWIIAGGAGVIALTILGSGAPHRLETTALHLTVETSEVLSRLDWASTVRLLED